MPPALKHLNNFQHKPLTNIKYYNTSKNINIINYKIRNYDIIRKFISNKLQLINI